MRCCSHLRSGLRHGLHPVLPAVGRSPQLGDACALLRHFLVYVQTLTSVAYRSRLRRCHFVCQSAKVSFTTRSTDCSNLFFMATAMSCRKSAIISACVSGLLGLPPHMRSWR